MKRIVRRINQPIYCMAVADKDTFNTPYDVWMDPAGKTRNTKHNLPRVKIDVNGELIPVIIGDREIKFAVKRNIRKEQEIRLFLEKNRKQILDHWNGNISDKDVLNTLEPL